MKKFTFSSSPVFSKNLSKVDQPIINEINYPSILLLLSPIYFSLDALLFIFFNLGQKELPLPKIVGFFLHLLLIISFFILKKYYMSLTAQNLTFLLVRTCHLIVFMESEEWEGNLGQMRIAVNGIKLSYLEFVFFFLFNSPKFFMTSLVSNFVYIAIRVPTHILFDYFHLLLLLVTVLITILILEKEKITKYFLITGSKAFKSSKKNLSFRKFFNRFPENTINYFMEGIEEGIGLLDDEFGVIKQNHKFTDLLNKIGQDNPMGALFGAGITALKEGTEDLKSWYNEKNNFTNSLSKWDTVNMKKNFAQNPALTLFNLLAQVFPMQAQKLNPGLKLQHPSPQNTTHLKNLENNNLHRIMQINDLKVKHTYKRGREYFFYFF